MHIQALGHVVLKVRNLERSAAFYRDILGMKEVARYRGAMVFFSSGSNHHDLAMLQLGEQASLPGQPRPLSRRFQGGRQARNNSLSLREGGGEGREGALTGLG